MNETMFSNFYSTFCFQKITDIIKMLLVRPMWFWIGFSKFFQPWINLYDVVG